MSEQKVISPLMMDRSDALGNSDDGSGRRALHVRAFVSSPTQPADYDSGEVAYPNGTTEIYTFKKSGVTLKTITIAYTDESKTLISNWSIA